MFVEWIYLVCFFVVLAEYGFRGTELLFEKESVVFGIVDGLGFKDEGLVFMV